MHISIITCSSLFVQAWFKYWMKLHPRFQALPSTYVLFYNYDTSIRLGTYTLYSRSKKESSLIRQQSIFFSQWEKYIYYVHRSIITCSSLFDQAWFKHWMKFHPARFQALPSTYVLFYDYDALSRLGTHNTLL